MARITPDEFQIMIDDDAAQIVKDTARKLFTAVVSRTPVRTGRARASWRLSVDKPDTTVAPVGGSPESPQPAPKPTGLRFRKPRVVYITNSIPYLQYLEYGSPTTPATGMVAASLASFQ